MFLSEEDVNSKMTIEIRQAKESEIDQLLLFEKGIVEAERPFDSSLKMGEIHYYDLIALIKSDDAEVLVAVVDDEIVGSGYAKIILGKSYHKFTEYAHLGFMYVQPAFRGNAINQKIVNELIDWAKSKHITEVRLEVYEENVSAKKAYSRAGFKPNLLEMRMEI